MKPCGKNHLKLPHNGITVFYNESRLSIKWVEELAVDDFIGDSFREGNQTGVDDLLTLVFCVSDVVVELNYFFQQHQHVLRLHLLFFGDDIFLYSFGLIDFQFRLHFGGEVVDSQSILKIIEEGD